MDSVWTDSSLFPDTIVLQDANLKISTTPYMQVLHTCLFLASIRRDLPVVLQTTLHHKTTRKRPNTLSRNLGWAYYHFSLLQTHTLKFTTVGSTNCKGCSNLSDGKIIINYVIIHYTHLDKGWTDFLEIG